MTTEEAAATFPLDDVTLELLAASVQMNPDTGQTHLHDFLRMGEQVESETPISDGVSEVVFKEGYEPWSEHDVILALVREVQRLRELNDDLALVLEAKNADDGTRVSLDDIKKELGDNEKP